MGKLVRLIRELKPQVLITFGPKGIYGHYDHIAVHRWTSIAYDLAADPGCFPDSAAAACAPHQVSKHCYRVLPGSQVAAMAQGDLTQSSLGVCGGIITALGLSAFSLFAVGPAQGQPRTGGPATGLFPARLARIFAQWRTFGVRLYLGAVLHPVAAKFRRPAQRYPDAQR